MTEVVKLYGDTRLRLKHASRPTPSQPALSIRQTARQSRSMGSIKSVTTPGLVCIRRDIDFKFSKASASELHSLICYRLPVCEICRHVMSDAAIKVESFDN